MSSCTQLFADPLLPHDNMTSYCKSLMSYAKAHHRHVKEVLQIQIQRILLVMVRSLVIGYSGNIIREKQLLIPLGKDLT